MAYFLSVLVRMSILGSLLAGLLLLLQAVLKKQMSMSVSYYLWLLVLLRLCVPSGIRIPIPDTAKAAFERSGIYKLLEHAGEGLQAEIKGTIGRLGQKTTDKSRQDLSGAAYGRNRTGQADWQNQPGAAYGWNRTGQADWQNQPGAAYENSQRQAGTSDSNPLDTFSLMRRNWIEGPGVSVRLWQTGQPEHADNASGRIVWWFLIWSIGAFVSMLWYIGGYLYFSYTVRRSAVEAAADMRHILRELEPSGRVGLLRCPQISTPVLLGILHPVIVLPLGMKDHGQLRDIIMHELTHAKRCDLIYKWFTAAAASLHWFNPMMIWIKREIGRMCELSCDEAVMHGMDADRRYHYGQTLLAAAADFGLSDGRGRSMLSFCREREQLKERMVCIVKYRKKGTAARLCSVLAAFAVSGCALVFGTDYDLFIAAGAGTKQLSAPLSENAAEYPGTAGGEENLQDIFRKILQGESDFLYAAEDGTVKMTAISDVPKIFSPYSKYAAVGRFALADLDGDKEQEMVLQIIDTAGDMGGYMVLHRYQDQIYGSVSHYKTFENLKADGTYSYSTLIGTESGIGRMEFTKGKCVPQRTAYEITDQTWEKFSYFVNDAPATAKKYKAVKKRQGKKQDAVWHEFTDKGILEAFSPDSFILDEKEPAAQKPLLPDDISDMDLSSMGLYTFQVQAGLNQEQELTVVLYTKQPNRKYFAVDQILVYNEEGRLLQTIEASAIPAVEEYAWDGLFVNQNEQVGEPDIRDVNFDGAQDFGLLAVGTYPHNVPYSYFLWNAQKQRFEYGFTLFGSSALEADPERGRLVESWHDVSGEYKNYYKYKPDGSLQRQ